MRAGLRGYSLHTDQRRRMYIGLGTLLLIIIILVLIF
jgi:hypothetical protein